MTATIINIVTPIFAIVLAGFFYARWHAPDMAAANTINLRIFLPALVFSVIATNDVQLLDYQDLALAGVVVFLISGVIAIPIAKLFGFQLKTFLPPMMFNNCGNMGLPLALLTFGEAHLTGMVILFVVTNLLAFSVGFMVVAGRLDLRALLTNPILLASAAAVTVNLSDHTLPDAVLQTTLLLGQVSIPLLLFALGVRMTGIDLRDWRIGLIGAIASPLTGVIGALIATAILDIRDLAYQQLMLYAVLPPAVLSFIIAEQANQEPDKVAAIALIGNAAAIIVVPIALSYVLR